MRTSHQAATAEEGGRRRVLLIVSQPFFQWRGSPIRVRFDVQALAELGYAVDILTLPFGEDLDIPGVQTVRVPPVFWAKTLPIGPSLLKACFDGVLFFKAWRMVRRQRYAVLHGVEDAGFVAAALARRAGAALVYEKHSDPGSYRKGSLRNVIMAIYARAEGLLVRRADAVIGTGPELAAQARRLAPGKPVYHIPDIPSSLSEATPGGTARARAQWVAERDTVLITYVGSFAVYQGIELLFEAILQVCRRCRQARFLVIGGSGAEIAARRRTLCEQGIEAAVVFAGKVPPDQLPDMLAASDILLSPRIAGVNTPLKLLDYLKAGRAILATDHQANRQILDENTALFALPNAVAFADGICRLIEDTALREKLCAGGRAMIATQYNFAAFKRGLADIYATLHHPVRH